MAELKEMVLTRGEAQHVMKDLSRWKKIFDALCPNRDEENRERCSLQLSGILVLNLRVASFPETWSLQVYQVGSQDVYLYS